MQVNIRKLDKELYYHPQWPKDRPILYSYFHKSTFTDNDILIFGRLYVKYSHLHCFKVTELTNYFNFMLHKMQIHNAKQLFERTRQIYLKNKNYA